METHGKSIKQKAHRQRLLNLIFLLCQRILYTWVYIDGKRRN